MVADHIGCPACGHRIKEFELDICLKKQDGSEMYFYHTRCASEPERIIAVGRDGMWSLTRRYVFWDLEDGAA